jgi:hypothetical protein
MKPPSEIEMILDPQTVLDPPPASFAGWMGLLQGDYSCAVIRLATLEQLQVNHLVFASVELLPSEIRAPPNAGRRANFGEARFVFSRTVVTISEGLDWYEAAWQARVGVPGQSVAISTAALAPEPEQHRFVLRSDVPFSPAWHGAPRIHRLLPMNEPVSVLGEVIAGMATIDRWGRARLARGAASF